MIDRTSLDDLKTYLTWHLVHSNTTFCPRRFRDENFNFYGKTLRGAKEMRPRWKRCVDLTDQQLPDALGQDVRRKDAWARRASSARSSMVAEIEKAMEKDIQAAGLDDAQDQGAGAGEAARGDQQDRQQGALAGLLQRQSARDDAFGNAERASEFEMARQLGKIGKPVDKTDWEMSQPTVNAYYDPQENDINFPAGILQPPFYDNQMDDAVNYGAIGAVIGHELTHGFDDQGRQYDAKGNLRDWWTAGGRQGFRRAADCLVKEYGGFTAVDDVKLNGKLTLGENTADNGGLRIAYMALMDTCNGQAAAANRRVHGGSALLPGLGAGVVREPHATKSRASRRSPIRTRPAQFRVNGVVSNMPEFRKAFSCKEGQPMAPAHMCRVW